MIGVAAADVDADRGRPERDGDARRGARRPARLGGATAAGSARCSSSGPGPVPSRRRSMAETEIVVQVERHGAPGTGRAPAHAGRLHPRAVPPHRHAPGLRARRVRRLHRPARRSTPCARAWCSRSRPTAPRSPPSRAQRPRRGALDGAGGVPRPPRAAVRLLHPRLRRVGDRLPARTTRTRPTQEIREGLSGNLCRCTGYQGILRAIQAAAEAGISGG